MLVPKFDLFVFDWDGTVMAFCFRLGRYRHGYD